MRTDVHDPDLSWASMALGNVTIGSLLSIWSGLWLVFLLRHRPDHSLWTYLAVGFLLTGLTFVIGGGGVGLIRRRTEEDVEEDPEPQAKAT